MLKFLMERKAIALHGNGQLEEAYEAYCEAEKKGALKSSGGLLAFSVLLLKRGDYQKAMEVLRKMEKAPKLTPQYRAQMLTNYAVANWKIGRIDYAVELVEEVFRKNQTSEVYSTLGYLLIEQGDYEKALNFNLKAVEYDDEDPIFLDNLAQTYYRLGGEKEKAKALFEKAVKCKPEAIDSNYFLALYDLEEGKYEAAAEKLAICEKGSLSPLNYVTKEKISEAKARIR